MTRTALLLAVAGLLLAVPVLASTSSSARLSDFANATDTLLPPGFWPDLSLATLAWFAAVVILALTVRLTPLLSLRNLDAIVLVLMGLLIVLRTSTHPAPGETTWQAWAYVGLSVTILYWLIRGLGLLFVPGMPRYEGNVSRGAMVVLLLAGLAIGVHEAATAPLDAATQDAIVGGEYFAATGHLPYGALPAHDGHSPLLYLTFAGATQLIPPAFYQPDGTLLSTTWENRAQWLDEDWATSVDLTCARLVNAVLFIGVLIGLYVIGRQLHSPAVGPTMIAIFCVFPGAVESFAHPAVMLPALLVTWTLALALVPVVGGLLATLLLVFTGLAWPWAWLGLPVVLAYFWRRGWQAAGASVGLLGGVALCGVGLLTLVAPQLPRAEAAFATAGQRPALVAHVGDESLVVFDPVSTSQPIASEGAWTGPVWRCLLDADKLRMTDLGNAVVDWPNGMRGPDVRFAEVAGDVPARAALAGPYAAAWERAAWYSRLVPAIRTVAEATWFPVEPEHVAVPSAWEVWAGSGMRAGGWLLAQRLTKIGAVLVIILAALVVLIGGRVRPRHLVAGLLATFSAAVLASAAGAVTHFAWLLPVILTLRALHETPESKVDIGTGARFTDTGFAGLAGEDGPVPRITVDD